MVKILSDGREKHFYEKCSNCATEFEYRLSDTKITGENKLSFAQRTVECPVCYELVSAMLLTKEEHEKNFRYFPYGGCAV